MRQNIISLAGLIVMIFALAGFVYAAPWDSLAPNKQDNSNDEEQITEPLLLTVPWLETMESSEIVYFLYETPARIERYDLNAESWLTDIELAESPTAFFVDSQGLYISFGRRTSRFNLDGTDETHLRNTPSDVTRLLTRNDYLYIYHWKTFDSINKLTGEFKDSRDYHYLMSGLNVAPNLGKIFGRTVGSSPADILEILLNDDGTLGNEGDSPYHGDYPRASETFIFPTESRVADDSGIIYFSNNLTYGGSLAGAFDDLEFFGDLPIVLRDGYLIAYSNTFLESGRHQPNFQPLKIYVKDDQIFSFYESGTDISTEKISIDLLTPEEPGQPVDPNGLSYSPDEILISKDEDVLLLNRGLLSIFRWSVPNRAYTDTLPLLENPNYMAYSRNTDDVYLSYPAGKITRIPLSLPSGPNEIPFANSPQTPCGLSTAGSYLFVCDPTGAWVSHITYSPTGTLISQVEWNYTSDEYVWNDTNRKMYFIKGGSPRDLLWEEIDTDGTIGTKMDSPYHSSEGMDFPVRVAPDGSVAILGSGRIYDANSLSQVDSLSNDIDDAVWHNGDLFTLRVFQGHSQVQQWGSNYGISATLQLSGDPLRMFSISEGLLVITQSYGKPYFTILDDGFNIIYESLNHKVYLPLVNNQYCPPFFDDFSHSNSGWYIGDNDYAQFGYINGEYQIRSKKSGFIYLSESPSCISENYVVELDARWSSDPGSSYGIVFGIVGNYDKFYLFDINTDLRRYRLAYVDQYGWVTLIYPAESNVINSGQVSNHLKIVRDGNEIKLIINGSTVRTYYDGRIAGPTSAGIVSSPYSDQPHSDARFDNFSFEQLQGVKGSVSNQAGTTDFSNNIMTKTKYRLVPWKAD